jgi:hypothetical protein
LTRSGPLTFRRGGYGLSMFHATLGVLILGSFTELFVREMLFLELFKFRVELRMIELAALVLICIRGGFWQFVQNSRWNKFHIDGTRSGLQAIGAAEYPSVDQH